MGSKSSSVTVGYRYYFGLHMGIGRGPVDELVEIRVGDRTAWQGSIKGNQQITIDKPELFGGDSGEGGIVGPLDVMMGEPDQPVNSALAAMLGGLVPAFRGLFTLFFNGQISALNPYPKPWKIRYRRLEKGWSGGACWYPSKVRIPLADGQIHAMNPAHILVACQTDRNWGKGHADSRIDWPSYQAAADQLYEEGFGLCLLWTRKGSVNEFMQSVIDHIGGAQFVSRRTGLITLRLIREAGAPEDLPLFEYGNGLLAIEEDTMSSAATVNEVVINYRDPITNKDRSAREQDLGAIQAAGRVISSSIDMPGLPTHELASRVAQREVRVQRGVRKFKVTLSRRARELEPGGLFRIRAPEDGIEDITLRVGRVDTGTVDDAAITVTALLDVFGLPNNVYTAEQPSTWQPPNRNAQPPLYQRLMEVSFRDLVRRTTEEQRGNLADDSAFLAALGVRPTGLSLSYELTTRIGSTGFQQRAAGNWVPTAVLESGLDKDETVVTLANGIDLDQVAIGGAALLDDEIVRVDALNLETRVATVARACADTVPEPHEAGARIWFYDGWAAADETEYVGGDTVDAKLLTRTSAERLDPALATTLSLRLDQRQARPYPPAQVWLNGSRWPARLFGPIQAAWAHRDRLLQQDVLVPWTDGPVGPEPGTAYVVTLWEGAAQVAQETVTGDQVEILPPRNGVFTIELTAVRAGLESWQSVRHTFEYTTTAPRETETGVLRLTEDGQVRTIDHD